MITVWMLVLVIGIRDGGGVEIIDNIVSYEECVRVGERIKNSNLKRTARNLIRFNCLEVNKVR